METLRQKSARYIETVGHTPIINIADQIGRPGAEVYGVMEFENPGGSHKDRPVARMIHQKILKGEITERSTVIDYTTGSAGNSVAVMCRAIGLRACLVMPERITEEREQLIRSAGAALILTPYDRVLNLGESLSAHQIWIKGAVARAVEICDENPDHVLLNQSVNPNNSQAFHSLGSEILQRFRAAPPTHVIASSGTGATVVGLGEFFRKYAPHVKVVAVDVAKSASTWALKYGEKFTHEPHKLYGTGAGAASPIVQQGIRVVDRVDRVDDDEAYDVCRELERKGLPVGPTTGANIMVARKILEENPTARIVVICHDKADRYRSAGL